MLAESLAGSSAKVAEPVDDEAIETDVSAEVSEVTEQTPGEDATFSVAGQQAGDPKLTATGKSSSAGSETEEPETALTEHGSEPANVIETTGWGAGVDEDSASPDDGDTAQAAQSAVPKAMTPAAPDAADVAAFAQAFEAAGADAADTDDAAPQTAPVGMTNGTVASGATTTARPAAPVPAAPEPPPQVRFVEQNHNAIVTGVRGELLPDGGRMIIRLDPPELGDLQISVQMRDGVMTAAFRTSNDEATRLLSHSLSDLKSLLESHGVSVDKLHVQQGPRDEADFREQPGQRDQHQSPEQRDQARREEQRKQIFQKMWDRLAGARDAVDVTA